MRTTKKLLSMVIALIMVFTIIPVMTIQSDAAYNGTLKFDSDGKFKIVQITDIQDDSNVEDAVMEMIRKAVTLYEPDLIVMTGDNVKTNMSQSNFKSSVDEFMAPIISAGIPYAITFGNHDSEGSLAWGRQNQYDYYISMSNLGVDFDVNSLSGVGSGNVPIYSQDGSNVKFNVWLMDSHDYDSNGDYGYVQTDQINWYKSKSTELKNANGGNPVPSLTFQHIPVPQIYDLLTVAASSTPGSVVGQCTTWKNNYWILNPANTTITGIMKEGPCPSVVDNGQFAAWQSQGDIVGAFFGHDHKNNFVGTTDGVTMGYSKAATLNSYNDGDPGFRYFEVFEDGTYTTRSVTTATLNVESGGTYEHDVIAGTLTVPRNIFVGASDNSQAKQAFGNTIQIYTLNHTTQKLVQNDLAVSVELPATCTNVALTMTQGVNFSAGAVETHGENKIYNWTITGGTAIAGDVVTYTLTYSNNGVDFTQYAYSYVDNIRSAAGIYVFTRMYRGGNSTGNFCSVKYVMTLTGLDNNVYGSTRAIADDPLTDVYAGGEVGAWTTTEYSGYYNFASGEEDGGYINAGSTNYGLDFMSPSRVRIHSTFPRYQSAGRCAIANVYVDLDEKNEDNTQRYSKITDLNLRLNFFVHQNNDNNVNMTVVGINTKTGDAGYTPSTWATGNTTDVTTNWNSGDYISYQRGTNKVFNILGEVAPVNNASYTIIPQVWAHYDGGSHSDANNYVYTPILLKINSYEKGELRELVNAERALARQSASYATYAFNSYIIAFREAHKVLYRENTDQVTINSAVAALNHAIANLESGAQEISDNSAFAGNVSVPSVVYVGASNYGLASQQTGTTILPQVINPHTRTMSSYTNFSITVPEGASAAGLSVSTPNGTVNVSYDSAAGTGSITGGTAQVGQYIKYTFTYTLGGKTYTQIAASYIANAPRPSGWNTFIRRSNWVNSAKGCQMYVSFIAPAGVTPAGAIFQTTGGTYTGDGSNGFMDFNFSALTATAYASGGIIDWTKPERNDDDEWFCGNKNDAGSAGSHFASSVVYVDPGAITNASQLNLKFSAFCTGTADDSAATTQEAVSVTPAGYSVSSTGLVIPNTVGQGFTSSLTGSSIPGNNGVISFTSTMHNNGNWSLKTNTSYNITFIVTDKSELRNLVTSEVNAFRQLHDGYLNDDGSFTAYQNALAVAQAALYNTTLNAAQNTAATVALQQAVDALKYQDADYTAVINAINTVSRTVIEGGVESRLYRPNPINDPTYYELNEFYPVDYYLSYANEMELAIEAIDLVNKLDCRYQATVDAMASGLLAGWTSLYLKGANLTAINTFLGYNEYDNISGSEIINIANNSDSYPDFGKEKYPVSFYTVASLQAWEDAVADGKACADLKACDQELVNTRAAALDAAYDGLVLKSADYSVFNATKDVALENIGQKVNVVDPTGAATFQINYYSDEMIANIQNTISGLATDLLKPQQNLVDEQNDILDGIVQTIGSNLNNADYTFAYAQRDILAQYEADYAYYYTPESWAALTTARNAIRTGKKTNFQSDVDTYALNIYNARNALVYNPADYSAIDELRRKADLLTPSNYTNWAALENAFNAVVRDYDVTQQAQVNTWAANIQVAYDNLTFKLATITDLVNAINAARAKDRTLYTTASYNNLLAALTPAEALRDEQPIITRQSEVTEQTNLVLAATANLVYLPANTTALQEAVALENTFGDYLYYYQDDEYSYDEVWAPMQNAFDDGNRILNDSTLNITDQGEVDAATALIRSVYNNMPAVYANVYAAIERMPVGTDRAAYTTASLTVCDNLIANYDKTIKFINQTQVEAIADAINEAIDNLEYNTADFTSLIAAISNAEAVTGSITSGSTYYTEATWTPFIAAYNDAIAARDQTPPYLFNEQETVNAFADALSDATTALVYKRADYADLEAMRDAFLLLDADLYTAETYNPVVTLITTTIDWNKDITQQTTVDVYEGMLQNAIAALVFKPADYSAVTLATETFNAKTAAEYTSASWQAVVDAIEDVDYTKNASEQAVVDGYAAAINEAIASLVYIDADLSGIIAAINAANTKVAGKETWYTEATYTPFTQALAAAIAIRDAVPAYKIDRNSDIAAAITALNNASSALTYKLADYTALSNALDSAAALEADRDLYTNFNILDTAVQAGAPVFAQKPYLIDEQALVNTYAQNILDAIEALELKPNDPVTLVPTEDSTVVIDDTTNFIYGITAPEDIGPSSGLEELGLADVTGIGYLVYTPTDNGYGTGTKVELYEGEQGSGTLLATYYIVIFGDVNGDALYDEQDVSMILDYVYFIESESSFDFSDSALPQTFAADIDGSYDVSEADIAYILDFVYFANAGIDQTNPSVPL